MTQSLAVTEWCDITQVGLKVKRQPTWEEYEETVHTWIGIHRVSAWVISDLYNYGEKKWGETYAQAMDETGLSYGYLASIRSVASKVPMSRRNPNLSFSHHTAVASLPAEQQRAWLKEAEDTGMSRDELRDAIKNNALPSGDEQAVTIIHNPQLTLRELVANYVKARDSFDPDETTRLFKELKERVKDLL